MTGPSRKRQRREEYRKAKDLSQSKSIPTVSSTEIDSPIQPQHTQNALQMPKKKFYRQRAHANPFSDHALIYPSSPDTMDWTLHFPAFTTEGDKDGEGDGRDEQGEGNVKAVKDRKLTKSVEIADIGCGFGGLIVALSPLFPETLMIGMELRNQVTDYVVNRIAALRSQNLTRPHQASTNSDRNTTTETVSSSVIPPPYQNISAIRSNTMKFLPNYFHHHQLSKIFLCFPDPHFKQRKHKARIVSAQLNAEYAYVLRPGGKVYTITDVEELHFWMVKHFENRDVAGDVAELWERVVDQAELDADPCVKVMSEETEEGKKVTRNKGKKYIAVFRRKEDPEWPD